MATHASAHANPRAVSLEIEDQIVRLRKTLTKRGLDAGVEMISAHLATVGVDPVPATSTIWRILSRRGFVTRQPQKRPRSSWRTFCADQPNERWQADITHWHLADSSEVEICNILDDHSRVNIAAKARLFSEPFGGIIPCARGAVLAALLRQPGQRPAWAVTPLSRR